MRLTPLLVLVGPTGSGKTAVGVALCELLQGELISADSVQIYRGCDIGSAKPDIAQLRRARHHLVDICDPWQPYSAAAWARDASAAIAAILDRGHLPIVAGGTGFYIKALLQPATLAPVGPDPEMRRALEAEVSRHGALWAHRRLETVDAAAAARLHPNDVRRVMRALEVAAAAPPPAACAAPRPAVIFGLDVPRPELYARLDARVDAMLAAGFLDELARLRALANRRPIAALQALGYRQMLPALDDSTLRAACVELWKRDTRRYAKRQMTWFRHQFETRWLAASGTHEPAETARHIAGLWRAAL